MTQEELNKVLELHRKWYYTDEVDFIGCLIYDEQFKIIEKELTVLEMLIDRMAINIGYDDLLDEQYEYITYNGRILNIESKEEYELLKEMLSK